MRTPLTGLISLLVCALSAAPAAALDAALKGEALAAYRAHGAETRFRSDIVVIVDLAAHSATRRLHILDLETGATESWRTTHGSGSDADHDGYADAFSNRAGSRATSLGAYRTAERYVGQWGLSLRLDGLDASNSRARDRAIVIHPAAYVGEPFIARYGKAGRSWGCFALAPEVNADLIARIEGGVFLYAGLSRPAGRP